MKKWIGGCFVGLLLGSAALLFAQQPVTVASGTVGVSSLPTDPLGVNADAAATAGAAGTISAKLRLLTTLADNLSSRRPSDPCFYGTKLFVPISQATSTQLFAGTASNRIYVCSLLLTQPSASTQTFSLVSGTGSVCATSTGAMIGATSAANGMQLPFVHGGGESAIAKSDTDAENVCLLQSSTDRLAGVLSYVVAVN